MIEIPLTSDAAQTFKTALNEESYTIVVQWNSRAGIWTISFYQDGTAIVEGVGLLGGVDILGQYNLAISDMYVVNTADPSVDATFENLGTDALLVMIEEGDLNE